MLTPSNSSLERPIPRNRDTSVTSMLPEKKTGVVDRYLRVRQIVKPDGMLPICRSTFLHWVKINRIPPGIKIGRIRVWKESEILGLFERLEAEEARDG